jgi:hypothetical protein
MLGEELRRFTSAQRRGMLGFELKQNTLSLKESKF